MKMKTSTLLTAVLLGATLAAAAFAQDGDTRDTRPALERGQDADTAAPTLRHRGPRFRARGRRGPNPERTLERLDTDDSDSISFDEFSAGRLGEVDRAFERLDRNGNGLIEADELERRQRPRAPERPQIDREAVIACVRESVADYDTPEASGERFDNADTDADGSLDLDELSTAFDARAHALFERLDNDGDGLLSPEELEARREQQLNLRRAWRACVRQELSGG